MTTGTRDWHEANQRYLTAALSVVRERLEAYVAALHGSPPPEDMSPGAQQALEEARATMSTPPALENLCSAFGLSAFERDVLLLCAGMELDASFPPLCAAAQGDPGRAYPTFSLAMSAFEDPHWSALSPSGSLRNWRFIDVSASDLLTTGVLRIDEGVLHYLAGVWSVDERLRGLTDPVGAPRALPASQRTIAEQVALAWRTARVQPALPVVQLCGDDTVGKRAIAAAASGLVGLTLRVMSASAIPRNPCERDLFIRLWERESALNSASLLIECEESDTPDLAGEGAINRVIDTVRSPLLVSTRNRRPSLQRLLLSFDVPRPTSREQRELWSAALGEAGAILNGNIEMVVSHFNLSAGGIFAAAARARHETGAPPAADTSATTLQQDVLSRELARALWDACRAESRPRIEALAQRIEPAAQWDDLVLLEQQHRVLREIAIHVRQRAKVYECWNFASKGGRGLGISALFAGASGTGKTMAAEVLASELRLDLFRVDLSQVVSKYIGETEKNLRRVFDAAEGGCAVLLFDEADALFGKRSEVKDSHDRYANIEISYLLQRMESYRGLAILATNLKNALDQAFLRRIRFVVDFPFPDVAQRAAIWRRIFPDELPTEGLRIERLARLNVTGGHIRNIAMNAAFLAADAGEPLRMRHLLLAARGEYAKLDKSLTELETAGWA